MLNSGENLMDKKKLQPHQAHPISRTTNGQLPSELAELTEEMLDSNGTTGVLPSAKECVPWYCSYDGDDAE